MSRPIPAKPRATKRKTRTVTFRDGLAMQEAGRFREAADIYKTILKHHTDRADVWCQLGTVLVAMGDLDAAKRHFEKAVTVDPDAYVAYQNLGVMCNNLGDLPAAQRYLKEAIRINPRYAEAYFSLAASTRYEPGDQMLEAVEDLCRQKGLPKRDVCYLHFAAGKMLDDLGEPARAFTHYKEGNDLVPARYDKAREEMFFAEQKKIYNASLFDRFRGRGNDSESPVFIVGMARSGTTLAEQVLSSHPKIAGVGELNDLSQIANALAQRSADGSPYPRCLRNIDLAIPQHFGDTYLKRTAAMAPGAERIVDKNPANFRLLGLMTVLFPNARIIHCSRSALDVCLSCYFRKFNEGMQFSYNLDHLAHYYRLYDDLMSHWREVLPMPVFDLRYEDMVSDQEAVTRKLLAFCGLDWDPQCARFFETKRAVRTASSWQVRQPLYTSSVGRWKLYETQLQPLIEALGPLAET